MGFTDWFKGLFKDNSGTIPIPDNNAQQNITNTTNVVPLKIGNKVVNYGADEKTGGSLTNPYDNGDIWNAPKEGYELSGHYQYDPVTHKRTYVPYDAEDNLHQEVDYYTDAINKQGVEAPAPDVKNPYERGTLEKILDGIFPLGYGVRNAIKGAMDDDSTTTFLGNFGKGIASAYQDTEEAAKNRLTTNDLGKALQESSDAGKRNLGKVLDNPVVGFAGDILTDPSSYFTGVAKAGSVLAKGSKALKAGEYVGDAEKAKGILAELGQLSDDAAKANKQGEYLYRKASKAAGFMPDYEGIRFELPIPFMNKGFNVVKPETIGKFADTGLGQAMGTPFKYTDKFFESIKHSPVGNALAGTANYDLVKQAKLNPNQAMKFIAQKDNVYKKHLNAMFAGSGEVIKTAREKDGDVANNKNLHTAIENYSKVTGDTKFEYSKEMEKNPEYITQARNYRKRQITEKVAELNDATAEWEKLKADPSSDVQSRIAIQMKALKLQDTINNLGNLDNVESTEFEKNLVASGLMPEALKQYKGTGMVDPVEWHARSLQEATRIVKKMIPGISAEEAKGTAIYMKSIAESTINHIKVKYPKYADNLTSIERIKLSEPMSEMPEAAAGTPDNIMHEKDGASSLFSTNPHDMEDTLKYEDPQKHRVFDNPEDMSIQSATEEQSKLNSEIERLKKLHAEAVDMHDKAGFHFKKEFLEKAGISRIHKDDKVLWQSYEKGIKQWKDKWKQEQQDITSAIADRQMRIKQLVESDLTDYNSKPKTKLVEKNTPLVLKKLIENPKDNVEKEQNIMAKIANFDEKNKPEYLKHNQGSDNTFLNKKLYSEENEKTINELTKQSDDITKELNDIREQIDSLPQTTDNEKLQSLEALEAEKQAALDSINNKMKSIDTEKQPMDIDLAPEDKKYRDDMIEQITKLRKDLGLPVTGKEFEKVKDALRVMSFTKGEKWEKNAKHISDNTLEEEVRSLEMKAKKRDKLSRHELQIQTDEGKVPVNEYIQKFWDDNGITDKVITKEGITNTETGQIFEADQAVKYIYANYLKYHLDRGRMTPEDIENLYKIPEATDDMIKAELDEFIKIKKLDKKPDYVKENYKSLWNNAKKTVEKRLKIESVSLTEKQKQAARSIRNVYKDNEIIKRMNYGMLDHALSNMDVEKDLSPRPIEKTKRVTHLSGGEPPEISKAWRQLSDLNATIQKKKARKEDVKELESIRDKLRDKIEDMELPNTELDGKDENLISYNMYDYISNRRDKDWNKVTNPIKWRESNATIGLPSVKANNTNYETDTRRQGRLANEDSARVDTKFFTDKEDMKIYKRNTEDLNDDMYKSKGNEEAMTVALEKQEDRVIATYIKQQSSKLGLDYNETNTDFMTREELIDNAIEMQKQSYLINKNLNKNATKKQVDHINKMLYALKSKNPVEYRKFMAELDTLANRTNNKLAEILGINLKDAKTVSGDFKNPMKMTEHQDFYDRIKAAFDGDKTKAFVEKKDFTVLEDKAKKLRYLDPKKAAEIEKIIAEKKNSVASGKLKFSVQNLNDYHDRIDDLMNSVLASPEGKKVPVDALNLVFGRLKQLEKYEPDIAAKGIDYINALKKKGGMIDAKLYRDMIERADRRILDSDPKNFQALENLKIIDNPEKYRDLKYTDISEGAAHESGSVSQRYIDSLVFDTPKGKVKVEASANPEDVNNILSKYFGEDGITRNAELNIRNIKTNDAMITRDNDIFAGLSDDNAHGVLHDKYHIVGKWQKTAVKVMDTYTKEMVDLAPEEKALVKKALEDNGNIMSADTFDKGHVSDYARGFSKSKPDLYKNESFAEMAGIFFNEKTATDMQTKLPKTYKMIKDAMVGMPQKQYSSKILKGKSVKESLVRSVERYRKMLDASDWQKVENYSQLKAQLDDLKKFDEESMLKDLQDYAKQFNGKSFEELSNIPEFKELEKVIATTKYDRVIDLYPAQTKALADFYKGEFKKIADSEGIKELTDYLPHMINPDLPKKEHAQAVEIMRQNGFNIENPFNIFDLHRKWNGTIDEINAHMKEKYKIDNFFDTNVTRLYMNRAIANQRFLYKQNVLNDTIKLFGHKVLRKQELENLTKPEKINAFRNGIEQLGGDLNELDRTNLGELRNEYYRLLNENFNRGDMVHFRLNPKYVEKNVKTISDDEIEEAFKTRNASNENIRKVTEKLDPEDSINQILQTNLDSPFIHVDYKNIKPEELYEYTEDGLYLMPKSVHDNYKFNMEKQFEDHRSTFGKLLNKYTQLFKVNATAINPSFHVNNTFGNMFQNWLDIGLKVFSPKIQYEAFKASRAMEGKHGLDKKMFNGMTAGEFADLARSHGVLENSIFDDTTRDFIAGRTNDLNSKARKTKGFFNPVDTDNFALYRAGKGVGTTIESNARLTNFIAHLMEGKTAEEAADLTNKFLFDYNDLSDFEHNTMKSVIPFYTWLRKNVPLQAEQMFEQPAKYIGFRSAKNQLNQEETDQQKMLKPDYLESAIHLGNNKYINPNLPVNDLAKMLSPKDMYSSANPLLKLLAELPTNKNIYYDSPIRQNEYTKVNSPFYTKPLADKNGKIDPTIPYVLKSLIPSLDKANFMLKGDEKKTKEWLTGTKFYSPNLETESQQALYDYIQRLKNKNNALKKESQ